MEMTPQHQEKEANAKLGAAIKSTTSLDVAKDVQAAIDAEPSVQPHNMEALIAAQAEKIWKAKEKTLLNPFLPREILTAF